MISGAFITSGSGGGGGGGRIGNGGGYNIRARMPGTATSSPATAKPPAPQAPPAATTAATVKPAPKPCPSSGPVVPEKVYHYTSSGNVSGIMRNGLASSSGKVFTTPVGTYSPIEAQMHLALPPNRGLANAVFEINTKLLPQPILGPLRVTPTSNAMGGGVEIIFSSPIPKEALILVR